MAVKSVKMSAEGYAKLEKEIEYLITVKRAEVAQKLKEARAFGDLSENAEYDEAKNEQGILEARINEMEVTLANATVVDDSQLSKDEINVGSVIKIKDIELDEISQIQIVGSTEADPDNGKISDESPVGLAVLRKKAGDIVEVQAPIGIIKMQIVEIIK
ncbi:MAG TPA: transcription elongation factor GreA [Oscillospiraceae bacterium]|nr:transcription elongation factor GreA [Oscillospiraceae bacterium]